MIRTIIVHTSGGDLTHVIAGNLDQGEIDIRAAMLRDYPEATFDVSDSE